MLDDQRAEMRGIAGRLGLGRELDRGLGGPAGNGAGGPAGNDHRTAKRDRPDVAGKHRSGSPDHKAGRSHQGGRRRNKRRRTRARGAGPSALRFGSHGQIAPSPSP